MCAGGGDPSFYVGKLSRPATCLLPWHTHGAHGIWPPLPIIITNALYKDEWPGDFDFDAAILHPNRIREIILFNLTRSQLQQLAARMQEQFPALIYLVLCCTDNALALPDEFLGGSAQGLRTLGLSVAFPPLPKFLISATDLVYLSLMRIPHTAYVSPKAIATCLAVMVNLKSFLIEFQSPLSCPNWEHRRPPPSVRTVFPALTHFRFAGVCEYLEDLMALIDAPLLDIITITFFHQLIFEIPQLIQFMRRTTRFHALNEAHVNFDNLGVHVGYSRVWILDEGSRLRISCRELDWQLSSLAQVFTSFFPSMYIVEHLYMYDGPHPSLAPRWEGDIDNMQWLEILEPFTAVKNLYLSEGLALHIAPALQEIVGNRMTVMLPTLQNISLEGHKPSKPIPEGIVKFVAARQLSGHLVTVSPWK